MEKTQNSDYYQVFYDHLPSGKKGGMGMRHDKIDGAINQITSLLDDPTYSKDRKYFIIHTVEVRTTERIEYPVSL